MIRRAIFLSAVLPFFLLAGACDSAEGASEATNLLDSTSDNTDAASQSGGENLSDEEGPGAEGSTAPEGDSACTPSCQGKTCGDDGCGSSCGACSAGQVCSATGQCTGVDECTQSCESEGWACGTLCGEYCGMCEGASSCQEGACVCTASCVGVECGDDGCGGTCGTCTEGRTCSAGKCEEATTCAPDCNGKTCGPDGCGGSCGACAGGEECISGSCEGAFTCTPNCGAKECGDDGCGGSCGTCVTGQTCSPAGQCQGGGVTGGANCNDTYNCIAQCGQDQNCSAQCQSLASAQAMAELNELFNCQSGCTTPDMTCIAETCIMELAECFFDIQGASSCSDMFMCLQSCPQMDSGCQDGCINQGTLAAQAEFMAINVCLSSSCPTQSDTCINQAAGAGGACEGYVNTCLAP